jgi:type VI secretion system secreted protein VgrG
VSEVVAGHHSDVNRLLAIHTVLDPDTLLVNRMTATERISRLFSFELELIAPLDKAASVRPSALIGTPACVHLQIPGRPKRFFHGLFSRVEEGSNDLDFRYYRAELSPWLWLLTLTSDCRIFQDKTVPEMITDIFREHGQFDFLDFTSREYARWDCCIQYRETAFNFVSRLMEHEGIFYFFQHQEDKHILTFADRLAGSYDSGPAAEIRFDVVPGHSAGEQIMTSWTERQLLTPGRFVSRDFHYGLPDNPLEFPEQTIARIGDNNRFEVYDFPGEFAPPFNEKKRFKEVAQEGERLARIRMEEEESAQLVSNGTSLSPFHRTGFKFTLAGHPTLNAAYVPLAMQHSVEQAGSHFHAEAVPNPYICTLTCAKLGQPFRPPRVTLRPVMQGPQTAIVVGPQGSEIHTDELGRIKVQFHWDRRRDSLGFWIRVAQIWAGPGWGAQFIPRVGHEVVVDFIEGDPDQPIVIGSVYNGNNQFPYQNPNGQSGIANTQSGIKSRSTPGGGPANFNEIRFEDKKGHEQLIIHAENAMSESVEGSQNITVGGNRSITTGGAAKDGSRHGDTKELVYKNRNLHVKGDERILIEGKRSEVVQGNEIHSTAGAYYLMTGTPASIYAPEVFIQGGTKLTLMVGGSFITLDPAGVTIVGPLVKLNPAGAIPPVPPLSPLTDPPEDP